MGKIIYLISVLKTIDWLTIVGFVIGVGFIYYITFIIKECEKNIRYYNSEERIKFYTQQCNDNIKIRKKIIVFVLMCVLLQVLIPAKEEMYAIALTKTIRLKICIK